MPRIANCRTSATLEVRSPTGRPKRDEWSLFTGHVAADTGYDPGSLCYDQPERRLMAAVLDDAIASLLKIVGRGMRFHRDLPELERWFRLNDRTWPYSFVNICEALDLEPEAVRSKVRQRCEQMARLRVANPPVRTIAVPAQVAAG